MSFFTELHNLPIKDLLQCSRNTTPVMVDRCLEKSRLGLSDFACLISPAAKPRLESICIRSQSITQQRFGKVIRLFAPLYLSNECINNCTYCGFARSNDILRVTLTLPEVEQEAKALYHQGFRNVLLVAGEHPKFVSATYLLDCVKAVHSIFPSVSLEVGPMETEAYESLVHAGADGLTIYQETYDPIVYSEMHLSGPKTNFQWRLETPERGFKAGFRRIGIGALYGLGDWRYEAICLAAHAQYLLRHCWKSFITISLPRMRPHAGLFQPRCQMSDAEMVQLICALRITFPDVGLVMSTREKPQLRDGLLRLGITLISAGSHTEPGGYTGAGVQALHHTIKGRIEPIKTTDKSAATGQFDIADSRPPHEIASVIQRIGYEPVWKDWDAALTQ